MKKLSHIFIIAMLAAGCASAESINRNISFVNYSDGISQQEAKYIAQKYCLDKKIQDIYLCCPEVEETFSKPGLWEVRFQHKDLGQMEYHYTLYIDENTGNVTYFAYEKF